MAVELKDAARLARIQTYGDGRCLGPVRNRSFNHEAVSGKDLGESMGDLAGAAGGTGHIDKCHRRVDQSLLVDGRTYSVDNLLFHDR